MWLAQFLPDANANLYDLVEYVRYAFGSKGLQEDTIEGHFSATKFVYRVHRGVEFDAGHPHLVGLLIGVRPGHVEVGT